MILPFLIKLFSREPHNGPLPPVSLMTVQSRLPGNVLTESLRQITWRWRLASIGIAKRLLDLLVAGTAALMLSPLLALTAMAIKFNSHGPILFFQERVGLRGKRFRMIKFRSMCLTAEDQKAALAARNESGDGVTFKMRRDPRITRVGAVIRRFSIDELPQIFNVLRGDMAIVGPRPPVPSEVDEYDVVTRKRLQAKPGLTCLWQIGGRSNLAFRQQVELDLKYLGQQNIVRDLQIIIQTVPAVISGKGAY